MGTSGRLTLCLLVLGIRAGHNLFLGFSVPSRNNKDSNPSPLVIPDRQRKCSERVEGRRQWFISAKACLNPGKWTSGPSHGQKHQITASADALSLTHRNVGMRGADTGPRWAGWGDPYGWTQPQACHSLCCKVKVGEQPGTLRLQSTNEHIFSATHCAGHFMSNVASAGHMWLFELKFIKMK